MHPFDISLSSALSSSQFEIPNHIISPQILNYIHTTMRCSRNTLQNWIVELPLDWNRATIGQPTYEWRNAGCVSFGVVNGRREWRIPKIIVGESIVCSNDIHLAARDGFWREVISLTSPVGQNGCRNIRTSSASPLVYYSQLHRRRPIVAIRPYTSDPYSSNPSSSEP